MLERILIPMAKAVQESNRIPAKVVEYTKVAEGIDRKHKLTESLGVNQHEGNFARTYMGYKIYERGYTQRIAELNENAEHAKKMADTHGTGSASNILIFQPMLGERRGKASQLITENALYKASVENALGQISEKSGDERARQIMSAVDEFLPLYFERKKILFSRERARIADAKIDDKLYELHNRLSGGDQNVH